MLKRYNLHPLWAVILIIIFGSIVLHLILFARQITAPNETKFSHTSWVPKLNQSDVMARRLPRAIIIGTRKSGTRALLKFLSINSAIRVASKEVHFFERSANYARGLDWYREQMPLSLESDITIEKSPAYFVSHMVPQRVKAMNSTIKLVLIFQDPVIRLISDYSQMIANRLDGRSEDYSSDSGSETDYDLRDPSSGIMNGSLENSSQASEDIWKEAEKSFERFVTRPDGGIEEHRRAIKIGMYSIYLEKWLRQFSLNQFHFVDAKRLITNPHGELQKLEIFLGVEPTIRQEDFVFNPRKGFFCQSLKEDSCGPHTRDRMRLDCKLKPSNVSISSMSCLGKTKGRRHVSVRQDLIEKLRRFYAPYNDYLYSLIGRNFSWTI